VSLILGTMFLKVSNGYFRTVLGSGDSLSGESLALPYTDMVGSYQNVLLVERHGSIAF
jgi:hypothetical protein